MENSYQTNRLVSTDWVADNYDDPDVVVLEVDLDTSAYDHGHIPGAVAWNWKTQLQDETTRDLVSRSDFEQLVRESGINNDSRVVLYGDNHNWFAAWALWQLEYYGFENAALMNGGREKWHQEGRSFSNDEPTIEPGNFTAEAPDESIRAYRHEIEEKLEDGNVSLVDVRCAEEYRGEIIAPEGMSETAQRGGHITGARNIPWSLAVNEDGTFRSPEKLKQLYESRGVSSEGETITYCRIGERSSHSWFVLTHLLDYDDVKNYDGSWTEWGNLVAAPIETGEGIEGHPAAAGVCEE